MSEQFLIAHKVSGEAAFDVAIRISCPECRDAEEGTENYGCDECDQEGFWWIIPTSGHRAYPWYAIALKDLQMGYSREGIPQPSPVDIKWDNIDWQSYPDHYPTLAAPDKPKLDLSALMKSAPIRRRV